MEPRINYLRVAINGWNRLAVGFRTTPGTYHPAESGAAASNSTGT